LAGFLSSKASRYTAYDKIFTVIGNKAILKNIPSDIKYLCLTALNEFVEDACDYDDEKDYPVADPAKLELLVKKDIASLLGVRPDMRQDGNPGTIETQQK
jgi:hypothetical protein